MDLDQLLAQKTIWHVTDGAPQCLDYASDAAWRLEWRVYQPFSFARIEEQLVDPSTGFRAVANAWRVPMTKQVALPGDVCAGCGKVMRGSVLVAAGVAFHPRCLQGSDVSPANGMEIARHGVLVGRARTVIEAVASRRVRPG